MILTAEDLSPKTRKEIALVADRYRIRLETAPVSMDEIWEILGRRSGVLGVADQGLAELLTRNFHGG